MISNTKRRSMAISRYVSCQCSDGTTSNVIIAPSKAATSYFTSTFSANYSSIQASKASDADFRFIQWHLYFEDFSDQEYSGYICQRDTSAIWSCFRNIFIHTVHRDTQASQPWEFENSLRWWHFWRWPWHQSVDPKTCQKDVSIIQSWRLAVSPCYVGRRWPSKDAAPF